MTPDKPVVTNNKLRAFNIGAAVRQVEVRQAKGAGMEYGGTWRPGVARTPDAMRARHLRCAHLGIMGVAMIPRNPGKSIQLLQLRKK